MLFKKKIMTGTDFGTNERSVTMSDFYVGDLVRIRPWEDMEMEFGTDEISGYIKCNKHFLTSMMKCCGLEFEIKEILSDDDGEVVLGHKVPYTISTDMIEHIDHVEFLGSQELDLFLDKFAAAEEGRRCGT